MVGHFTSWKKSSRGQGGKAAVGGLNNIAQTHTHRWKYSVDSWTAHVEVCRHYFSCQMQQMTFQKPKRIKSAIAQQIFCMFHGPSLPPPSLSICLSGCSLSLSLRMFTLNKANADTMTYCCRPAALGRKPHWTETTWLHLYFTTKYLNVKTISPSCGDNALTIPAFSCQLSPRYKSYRVKDDITRTPTFTPITRSRLALNLRSKRNLTVLLKPVWGNLLKLHQTGKRDSQ